MQALMCVQARWMKFLAVNSVVTVLLQPPLLLRWIPVQEKEEPPDSWIPFGERLMLFFSSSRCTLGKSFFFFEEKRTNKIK